MKGLLWLFHSLTSLLRSMRSFMCGFLSLRSIVSGRCSTAKLKRFGCGLLAVSVALFSLFSGSSASAIDNILDVQTWTFSKANIIKNNNVQSSCTSNVNYFTCAVSPSAGNWFNIAGFDLTPSKTIPADSYVVFNIEIHPPTNGYYSEFHYNGFVSNNSSEYVIVDQKVQPVEASRNNVSIQITLYTSKPSNWLSLRPTNGNGMAIQADLASGGNMNIIISPAEVITVVSGKLTNEVYQTILGAIKNGEFNVKTDNSDVVSSITDAADQAHKDSQNQIASQDKTTEAINNQAKQEQDQYDQEKQEEADRENSANEDGNKLLGIFNITLLNPFAGIWELFNADGCASIPTIANWLGTDQTVYCSWWPQGVRATLTSVFSLASAMLLFGFFKKWLCGSSSDLNVHIEGKNGVLVFMGELIKFGVKISLAIMIGGALFTAITTLVNLLTTIIFDNIIGEVLGIMSACLPFNAFAVFSSIGTATAAILSFLIAQKVYALTGDLINITS